MPNTFTNGKRAIAECDRCGFRFKLNQLRTLVIKTKNVNLKVCEACWEPDHPQLQLGMYPVADPQALFDPRPDRVEYAQMRASIQPVYSYLSGSERTFATGSVGTVGIVTPPAADILLLLHADGAAGSTSYIDSSTYARAITAGANALISNSTVKFGTGSRSYTNINSWLYAPPSGDYGFGTDDFTVEAWVYPTSFPTNGQIFSRGGFDTNGGWTFWFDTLGVLKWRYATAVSSFTITAVSTPRVLSNTWTHVAACRASGTLRMFVNGVTVSTTPSHTVNYLALSTLGLRIAGDLTFPTAGWITGFVDEMRVTKNFAFYTGDFAVPTAPFPNP